MSAKLQFAMSVVIVSLMVFATVIIAYWLYWPVDILEMHKIEILTPNPLPGSRLEYSLNYSKYKNISGDVTKQLIGVKGNNAVWAVLDRTGGRLPCGMNMKAKSGTVLPITTTPGWYILRISVRYPINLLRWHHEDYDTPPFEVLPGKIHMD